jgi:hypothetical protein
LPNLRHFDLPFNDFCHQAVLLRLVVGDRLQTARIQVNTEEFLDEDYPWDNVAAVLRASTEAIKTLSVQASEYVPPDSSIDIMQLCRAFQRLEWLDMPFMKLTHGILAHLATLPELKKLNASIAILELMQFNLLQFPDTDIFPCLSKLSLTTEDLTTFSELFNRPGFPRLRSFTIKRFQEVGIWNLDSFFQKLQNYLSRSPLEEIILCKANARRAFPPVNNASAFTSKSLEPLLSFPNISVLKVNLDGAIALDDAALKRVAESWPNLRVFCLFDQARKTIPSFTLTEGLLPLITACPQLEELTLRVNFTYIPTFARLGGVIPARNLRLLNVCTSTVTSRETKKITSFLMLAFPALAWLTVGWWYPDAEETPLALTVEEYYAECWGDVQMRLKPFTSIHSNPSDDKLDFR